LRQLAIAVLRTDWEHADKRWQRRKHPQTRCLTTRVAYSNTEQNDIRWDQILVRLR